MEQSKIKKRLEDLLTLQDGWKFGKGEKMNWRLDDAIRLCKDLNDVTEITPVGNGSLSVRTMNHEFTLHGKVIATQILLI